ncbi:unnamed protein product [Ixodes persulcatus]
MAAMAAADDAVCMDTAVPTNQAPASQGSDTNADDTGQEDDDYCFRLPSGGDIFRAQCIREPKAWTRSGQKLLASKDPEAEATQLQALAKERAQALAHVGAYKLADVAEATWHEERIVLTRHKGHFLSFMGRAVGRRTLLHPLETLFLVESGQLTLKRDGVPVSLPEAYELLLDGRDDMDQYRVYAHLLRAGYVVLLPRRTPKQPAEASPEAQSSPLGSSAEDSDDDDDDDDVVCLEDNDSDLDVVQVIPAKQAKTDAAELNSPVPDPAVGASKESKHLRPDPTTLDFPVLVAGRPLILQRPPRHLLPRNVSPCRDWYHLDPRHWEGPPRDPWGSPQTGQQGSWPGRDNQHWGGPPRHPWGSQEDNRQLWGDWRGGDRWERGGRGWRRVPWNDRRTWAPFRGPPLQQDSRGTPRRAPRFPRRGHWRDNGQAPPQRPHRGHRPAPQDDGYPSALPPLPQGSAHSWSQLKGGLAGAQRTRALLGGEGALLWRGPIKPLVLPSRDLSLGGIVSQLSLVQEVDLVKSCRHLRVPQARTLDVYLAAVGFRKTCPGLPEYRVAMVRWDEGVPTLRDLVRSSLGDGVPLVFASVDTSGQVQLFALEPLVAPHFAPGP